MPRTPPTERRAYHHGDLHSALVDVATDLVREHGSSGFSLREAARRVGVDPAACYRHFRDRSDLLVAIAQRGFERLSNQMESVVSASPDSTWEQRLLAMGQVYVLFACEYSAEFKVMFGESGTSAHDPRLRLPSVGRTAYEQLEDAIVGWAREASQRVNVTRCARLLWGGVHGVARLVVDGALQLSRSEIVDLTDRMTKCLILGFQAGGPATHSSRGRGPPRGSIRRS